MKKIYCIAYGKCRKFINSKISYIFQKTLASLSFAVSATVKIKRHLKKKNQWKY